MFDDFETHVQTQNQVSKEEEARNAAFRAQQRAGAEKAFRRLLALLRGARPSRDPNWNPEELEGETTGAALYSTLPGMFSRR